MSGMIAAGTPAGAVLSKGVGDVSLAMRYASGTVIGSNDPVAALNGIDDTSTTVASPFPINFFGTKYEGLCVTSNGTISPVLTASDDCSNRYDTNLASLARESEAPVIAALALDLDASECSSTMKDVNDGFAIPCRVYFGETTISGRDAVVVTWYRFPTNDRNNDPELTNTLQVVLLKKATAAGSTAGFDFDMEINIGTAKDNDDGYDATSLDPVTGFADSSCSGNTEGIANCRWGMGWANYVPGDPAVITPFELFADSPINDLIDSGGTTALVTNSLNSRVLGRYTWGMVGGVTQGFTAPSMGGGGLPVDPTPVVEGTDVNLVLDLNLNAALSSGATTLSGSGLLPRSEYQLILQSDPVILYTGTTNANGDFTSYYDFSNVRCPGTGVHTLTLVGTRPNGTQTKAIAKMLLGKNCSVKALVQGGLVKEMSFDSILFGYNSAKLTKKSKKNLTAIVPLLAGAKIVKLYGYTQTNNKSKMSKAANKRLGKARAVAVKKYLKKKGVIATFVVVGKGAVNPASKKKQELNRRILIKVGYSAV